MLRTTVDRAVGAVLIAGLCVAPLAAQGGTAEKKGGAPKADSGGKASGKAPGGGSPGGGQRTASVVLAATDVYKVVRGTVEAGMPIAGDLRPIETVTVRSRIDGILDRVVVREGQRVAAGEMLAKFESSEQESAFKSAEADRASARSDYETAKWNYDQSKELFKVGAIAERDLRASQQAADASQARLAATDARLKSAGNVVRDTRVVAPFSGTINTRKVQNGESTQRGAEMFTLVRSEILELTAGLPARRASEVRPGQAVRFVADGRQFTGKVARVSPTIDPASRSVTVYVQIPNPKGELKGNTYATGQIIAQTVKGALVVPLTAIRQSATDGKSFVYTVEGGQLGIASVTLGVTDDAAGVVEVKDGLKEQDVVIVGNVGTLGRGMKVTLLGNESKQGGRGGDGASGEKKSGGRGKKQP